MYASSWFLTLFLTFLPLPVATRIFDIFMYEVGNIMSIYFKYLNIFLTVSIILTQHIIRYMTCLQGLEIIFRVGLAILQYNQTDLIQLDMEGMSQVSSWSLTTCCGN